MEKEKIIRHYQQLILLFEGTTFDLASYYNTEVSIQLLEHDIQIYKEFINYLENIGD